MRVEFGVCDGLTGSFYSQSVMKFTVYIRTNASVLRLILCANKSSRAGGTNPVSCQAVRNNASAISIIGILASGCVIGPAI